MQGRSTSPLASEAGSSKRPRATAACEACRKRKLACSGEQPCARCMQDKRECCFEGKERRTPLTRVRMTLLEDRLSAIETLWSVIIPGFPIDDAIEMSHRGDIAAVVARAATIAAGGSHAPHANRIPSPRLPPTSFPPTRGPSPMPSSDFSPGQDNDALPPEAYEWHEPAVSRSHSQPQMDHDAQPPDAGMGSLISDQRGVSYLGLSSGATFLRAIRRLTPKVAESLGAGMAGSSAVRNTSTGELRWKPRRQDGARQMADMGGRVETTLPPMAEMMPLVESYFRYFHPLTPLVHEPTIRAQLMGALPISSKPGSQVLIQMIFAMGALDLSQSQPHDSTTISSSKFYAQARQALSRDMLEEGTLPLVQGLAIMANYLQRSNRPNAGYMVLGWAIRMSIALGLHTPVANRRCSPLEREMRVRVWWSIVTLEAGCSVTFGRPNAIGPVQLHSLPAPLNINDENLTVSTSRVPPDLSQPTLYTALIIQSKLAKVTCSIHDLILHSRPPTVEQIRKYDDRVIKALGDLPDFMQSVDEERDGSGWHLARSVQVWRARDFRTILYRPVLLAAAWDSTNRKTLTDGVKEAIETCRSLALANLQDIQKYITNHPDPCRGAEWYTLFFAFQAALTVMLSVVWEPNHQRAGTWKAMLASTAGWFRGLRSMQELADSYASILEDVIGVLPSPMTLHGTASGEALSAPFDPDTHGWNVVPDQQTASALDVDRYWLEIWGTEPANIANNGNYDPFQDLITAIGNNPQGYDASGGAGYNFDFNDFSAHGTGSTQPSSFSYDFTNP